MHWMQKQFKTGFTLIETMVAVTILLTAIAGPMSIAHQGAVLGRLTRDQMLASYLAQDAIEYVRYAIATNSNNGSSGASALSGIEDISACYNISCQLDSWNGVNVNPSWDLVWDTVNKRYIYGTVGGNNEATIFEREVIITIPNGPGSNGTMPPDTEYLITTTVTWNNGAETVEISDRIVDWRVVFN